MDIIKWILVTQNQRVKKYLIKVYPGDETQVKALQRVLLSVLISVSMPLLMWVTFLRCQHPVGNTSW